MFSRVILLILASVTGRAEEILRAPLDFAEVYICFAEEHASDLVSGFGHVFVCLPQKPAQSADDLLAAPAINFAADTSSLGEGAWVGRFRLGVCHELIRTNTFFQQRDVYFIKISTSPALRLRLAASLKERIGKSYPYNFLNNNCGVRITEWIYDSLDTPKSFKRPFFYLTPRESIENIILRVPAEGFYVYRSSASRVAIRAAKLGVESVLQARRAVKDVSKVDEVKNPALRLDVIRLNESRVGPAEYSKLQAHKRQLLESPAGSEVARQVVSQSDNYLSPMDKWVFSDEGPEFTLGLLYDRLFKFGYRIGWEAGLRGIFTSPVSADTRRVAKLLDFELDIFREHAESRFVLIGMHIDRDLPSVFGAGSSGFEISYIDRLNAAGSSGLVTESWTGVAYKIHSETWISFRLNLRVDEIQDKLRPRVLPSFACSGIVSSIRYDFHVTSNLGDIGYRIELSTNSAGGIFSLGFENDPLGNSRTESMLSYRF